MQQPTGQPPTTMSQAYAQQVEVARKDPARIALIVAQVVVYALWAIVIAITLLLVTGFLLQLLGANPEAGFVDWVYRSTDEIMEPFRGVFEPRVIDDKSVFDPSMLLAAIVYLLVVLVLDVTVLRWLRGQTHKRDVEITELQNRARDAATLEYYTAQQAQQVPVAPAPPSVPEEASLAPLVDHMPPPPPGGRPDSSSGWPA